MFAFLRAAVCVAVSCVPLLRQIHRDCAKGATSAHDPGTAPWRPSRARADSCERTAVASEGLRAWQPRAQEQWVGCQDPQNHLSTAHLTGNPSCRPQLRLSPRGGEAGRESVK